MKTDTYTLVIYGDVNGDGDINLNDLVSIRDSILGAQSVDEKFDSAGDFYGEGCITLNDLVGIMAQISGSGTISQNLT